MHFSSLLLCLTLGAFVKCAAGSDWCYHGCEHTETHWQDLDGSYCGDKRQSPIDIKTQYVKTDPDLSHFIFANFSFEQAIKSIKNTGHTVKCELEDGIEVSGGGLNGTYSAIQFHFHWGDTEHHPGSEHLIDGKRYPMEMHIVSLKKGLTVEQALSDSEGIAVLGFLINATDDGDLSEPWSNLTYYLLDITDINTEVLINASISINDLIGNVNLTKFYRYMGSLTTPKCNEAVVWTVFQEPININKNLIQQFSTDVGYVNVFRKPQALNGRQVYASPATPLPPSHAWCYDDHCEYEQTKWHLLPHSYCGGQQQSPVNIETKTVVIDEHLDAFTYTKFDDKRAIKSMTNTGHTVKCALKEDTVEVSGGGLGYDYSTLQFHFHWGITSHESGGSEHTVDSKRYLMEMHIVNKRKDLTLDQAVVTPNGLAVLGFFIEPTDATKSSSSSSSSDHQETSPTSDKDPWKKLTDYLASIQNISSEVQITEEISIDDLLGSVNRDAYFRYNGSLTTPFCNEAVVWTVFKESIKVHQKLMMMFPTQTKYHNVFRQTQSLHSRRIYSTKSASSARVSITLLLLLACLCALI